MDCYTIFIVILRHFQTYECVKNIWNFNMAIYELMFKLYIIIPIISFKMMYLLENFFILGAA